MTDSRCSSCGLGARKVVINAFHTLVDARLESPRCDNAMLIPINYASMVTMVARFAEERPINELEIAAHGSGNPTLSTEGRIQFVDDPGTPTRWEMPGAAIIGRNAEFVSGMSIETNAQHAAQSRRLGRCVQEGGIITWQCCNLGFAMAPFRDFLTAFSALAPHLAAVTAALGPTFVGTPGLQGAGAFEGTRAATGGRSGAPQPGNFPGFLPDNVRPGIRPLAPIVDQLQPRRT